jgi:Leucine-rich repeat (LRR) protein
VEVVEISNLVEGQKVILQAIEKELNLTFGTDPNKDSNYYVSTEGIITSLNLSNLNLSKIPDEVFLLKELIVLELSGNNLVAIPDKMRKLKNLTILDFANNRLTYVPSWISEFKLLKILKLNNNQLYSLPRTIGTMTLLRKLYLQSNQIHSLPFEIIELKLIEEIHLDFRATMKKTIKGVLTQLETKGCLVKNDYNRR